MHAHGSLVLGVFFGLSAAAALAFVHLPRGPGVEEMRVVSLHALDPTCRREDAGLRDDVYVWATVITEPDHASAALVSETLDGERRTVHLDEVVGDGFVDAISPRGIRLRSADDRTSWAVGDAATARDLTPPNPCGVPTRVTTSALARGIVESLFHDGTVRPAFGYGAMRDDRVAGVRLMRVRPDSDLALLGLRSGDLVTCVEGVHVGSERSLVTALRTLSPSTTRIEIDLERRGVPTRHLVFLQTSW